MTESSSGAGKLARIVLSINSIYIPKVSPESFGGFRIYKNLNMR